MRYTDWRPTPGGMARGTGKDGCVTIRRAYNGGVRITVSREDGGIFYPSHSRHVPYVNFRAPKVG